MSHSEALHMHMSRVEKKNFIFMFRCHICINLLISRMLKGFTLKTQKLEKSYNWTGLQCTCNGVDLLLLLLSLDRFTVYLQ
jgi:hypothetical protein